MKSIGVGPNHLFSTTPVHRHLPVMELTALREFRKSYAEQFDVFECLSSGLVLGVAHGLRGKKCRKGKKKKKVLKKRRQGHFIYLCLRQQLVSVETSKKSLSLIDTVAGSGVFNCIIIFFFPLRRDSCCSGSSSTLHSGALTRPSCLLSWCVELSWWVIQGGCMFERVGNAFVSTVRFEFFRRSRADLISGD